MRRTLPLTKNYMAGRRRRWMPASRSIARKIEQHLRACDECRRIEEQIRALRHALNNDAPAYRAPARLRRNIRAALRREAKATERNFSPWFVFATGAAFALILFVFVFFQ